MKSYKQFISEITAHVPVVSIDKNTSDLNNLRTVSEVNKNLKMQLNSEFSSLPEAMHKIKKILSMYSIEIPEIDSSHEINSSGKMTMPINQGTVSGEKHSGIVTAQKDSENIADKNITISYEQGNLGYKVSAEIF